MSELKFPLLDLDPRDQQCFAPADTHLVVTYEQVGSLSFDIQCVRTNITGEDFTSKLESWDWLFDACHYACEQEQLQRDQETADYAARDKSERD